jgi:hypothetical protein
MGAYNAAKTLNIIAAPPDFYLCGLHNIQLTAAIQLAKLPGQIQQTFRIRPA